MAAIVPETAVLRASRSHLLRMVADRSKLPRSDDTGETKGSRVQRIVHWLGTSSTASSSPRPGRTPAAAIAATRRCPSRAGHVLRDARVLHASATVVPLGFERRYLSVLAAKKCVVDILALPSDLNAPRPRFELGEGRQACARCAPRRRTGRKSTRHGVEGNAHEACLAV